MGVLRATRLLPLTGGPGEAHRLLAEHEAKSEKRLQKTALPPNWCSVEALWPAAPVHAAQALGAFNTV